MKNLIKIIFLAILIIGCMSIPPKLECSNLDSIKDEIKDFYNADRIEIESRVFKEELYFNEIRSLHITLYNATTITLDFKTLPTDRYERYTNYEEIGNGLETESIKIFNLIKGNCNLRNFNEITIVFGKSGDNDLLLYDFIVNYKI